MQQLDILCIGEIQSGKTTVLQSYCEEIPDEGNYKIFGKIYNQNTAVYLHELSNEEEVYIEQPIHGIIFFLNLSTHLNTVGNILSWFESYSKHTGTNIYKVPLRIVATTAQILTPIEIKHEKEHLIEQLSPLLAAGFQQILYYDLKGRNRHFQSDMALYFDQIIDNSAYGLKPSSYRLFRQYGLIQMLLPYYQLGKVFTYDIMYKMMIRFLDLK